MNADAEIYPMPLFVQLIAADLDASVEWYRAVGFDVIYEMPAMAHVRFRTYADVMLVADEGRVGGDEAGVDSASTPSRGEGVAVYLTLEDESVQDVADRAREAGVDAGDGPEETAWNTRELRLSDPDGYELVFSEPVDTDRSFEDVMSG